MVLSCHSFLPSYSPVLLLTMSCRSDDKSDDCNSTSHHLCSSSPILPRKHCVFAQISSPFGYTVYCICKGENNCSFAMLFVWSCRTEIPQFLWLQVVKMFAVTVHFCEVRDFHNFLDTHTEEDREKVCVCV